MKVIDPIVPAWFALAIFIEIASTMGLRLWLTRRGAKPIYLLSVLPGYLEHFYWKWSNKHRHASRLVLVLRIISSDQRHSGISVLCYSCYGQKIVREQVVKSNY